MADVSDPAIYEAIEDVRDDSTDTDWVALGYASKTKIAVIATGSSGHAGLMDVCTETATLFCLLRMVDGDQESRRIKFIGLTFVGEDVGGMQRGRVATHKGSVFHLCGQMNIEIQADNHSECNTELIRKKLKVAGGADYDTGSNAGGYRSQAKSIRAKSLAAYQSRERYGNIDQVVYTTSALPSATPMDLSGRPTVASASEAQKNTMDNVLDTDKFKGKANVYKGDAAAPGGTKKKRSLTEAQKQALAAARKASQDILAEKDAEDAAVADATKAAEESALVQEGGDIGEAAAPEPEPVVSAAADADADADGEDPEEKARLRAERRKARREGLAKKAKEDVDAFKQQLAEEEKETAKPKPAPPAKKPSLSDIATAQQEKKTSLFDEGEDDDDDLFAKPATAAATAHADDEDLPPGPEEEAAAADYSDATVSVPYAALKGFLVSQQLLGPDYSGTPEELAQLVIEQA